LKGLTMLDLVIEQRRKDLGGFEVGRVLPFAQRRMVGPFIFFDHMGPVDLPRGLPKSADVRPHPHICLSTITYLFDGEIMHRDSLGSAQPIRPGEVNWMTAGRGITHSERFERARAEGGKMHGIQAWAALPLKHEEIAPSFHHHGTADLPTHEGDGLWTRLVVGEAFGVKANVPVYSPMFYVDCRLQSGARVELPRQYSERAAYIVSGAVMLGARNYQAGRMLVFTAKQNIVLSAEQPTTVMLLGGEPIGERFIEWNFVASSKQRIEQAKADWRAGRMKLPAGDDQEFIPLPPDPQPSPNPMS
jgi:redox-sensitive bicupin YhaK (pirin superfamily)